MKVKLIEKYINCFIYKRDDGMYSIFAPKNVCLNDESSIENARISIDAYNTKGGKKNEKTTTRPVRLHHNSAECTNKPCAYGKE